MYDAGFGTRFEGRGRKLEAGTVGQGKQHHETPASPDPYGGGGPLAPCNFTRTYICLSKEKNGIPMKAFVMTSP